MPERLIQDDHDLLDAFVRDGSAAAFEQLVARHASWVFAAAQRQLRDRHLAEDATQAVFLLLCQKAAHMKRDQRIGGWLFRTTGFVVQGLRRARNRCERHERQAGAAQPVSTHPTTNTELAEHLDAAVAKLSEADRAVVLMRFYQAMEFDQLARALDTTEATARKRLSRAIERLRAILGPGVSIESLSAVVLVGSEVLTAHLPATAARVALAAHAGHAIPAGVGAAAKAASQVAWIATAKLATSVAALIVLATTAAVVVPTLVKSRPPIAQVPASAAMITPVATSGPATIPAANLRLDVRCLDPDGKPVAGAAVYVLQENGKLRWNDADPPPATVGPRPTDAAGVAHFTDIPVGNGVGYARRIYVRVPGRWVGLGGQYVPDASALAAASSAVDVQLVPAAVIHGMIKVPAGFQADSVAIRTDSIDMHSMTTQSGTTLWRSSGAGSGFLPDVYDTTAAADGSFTIRDLPAGSHAYLIANGDRLGEVQAFVSLNTADATTLQMRPQAAIRGRVTSPGGKPAAGLSIAAEPLGGLDVNHSFPAVTDANGRYTIEHLPGIAVALKLMSTMDFAVPVQTIRLTAGETIDRDLPLQTGTLASGRALAPDGRPLRDVGIGAQVPSPAQVGLASTATDADGRFTFRLPAGQCEVYVTTPPDGYDYPKRDRTQKLVVPENTATLQLKPWTLPLAKPRAVSTRPALATFVGRIVDDHGRGVSGLYVTDDRVEDWGSEMMPVQDSAVAKTDADGRFRFVGAAGIKHTLSPSSPDYDHPQTKAVTPTARETVAFADLVVHQRPVVSSVSGVVVDPQGRPLEGVEGFHDRDKFMTDADGRFTLPLRSTTAPVNIEMVRAGYRQRGWVDIPPGTKDIRLTMVPTTDKPLDYNAKSAAPDPQSLVGRPAPALHVDWVINSIGQAAPTTTRSDGRSTVLVFHRASKPTESLVALVRELDKMCADVDAVPLLVLSPQATEIGTRARFAAVAGAVHIGIDPFLAESNPNDIDGSTAMEYGASYSRGPHVYVIAPDGTVVHTQNTLDGLQSRLVK